MGSRKLTLATLLLFSILSRGDAHVSIVDGIEAINARTGVGAFPEVYAVAFPAGNSAEGKAQIKLCTATLIHPEVLLTSAHCLPQDGSAPLAISSAVRPYAVPNSSIQGLRSIRNSHFKEGFGGYQEKSEDYGVILLAKALENPSVARMVDLDLPEKQREIWNGALTVVGYGGKDSIEDSASAGIKRWGTTTLQENVENVLATGGPESGLSVGDSGGPLFLPGTDGLHRLIGIASGPPDSIEARTTGRSSLSLYAAMRKEIICWVDEVTDHRISRSYPFTDCQTLSKTP